MFATTSTACPQTSSGEHDWDHFERPAHTHHGDTETRTTPAM